MIFIFHPFGVREKKKVKFGPDTRTVISISIEIEVYPIQIPSSLLPKACILCPLPPDY